MLQVVSFGECMLELRGEAFGPMHQGFGGDSFNAAAYLARSAPPGLLNVAYATALGDDGLSEGLLQRWQAEGLDTRLVRRVPGRLPGLYLIELAADGERRFHYWRDRAAVREHFSEVPPGGPAGATPLEQAADHIDLLLFSGISLAVLPPEGRERLLALAWRLRARGARVAFDNNYRPRLWRDAAEARAWFAAAYAVADIALATLDDEMLLHGVDETEALARTLALPAPELVVKRGAQPTLVRLAGTAAQEVATEPVAHVVDTTAAGDSFAGAYLAARLAGAAAAAAAAGNRLAARVVQHRGALIPREAMADLMPARVSSAAG